MQKLPRQSGMGHSRYVYFFSGGFSVDESSASMPELGSVPASGISGTGNTDDRIALLEMQMADMAEEIKQLKQLVE
ncbi:MAG: hypothetical protein HRU20_19775 [Pseudomonadales bacterium]|nr:hypothetical protein [Pseudomonadales bacterium]